MKFGKRQLVLAVLVIALGAAVYLNWQFAGNKSLIAANTSGSSSSISEKELGAATYVNTQSEPASGASSSQANTSSQTAPQLSASSAEYFASARLNRQHARDKANEILDVTLKNEQIGDDVKSAAVTASTDMAMNTEQESNIENLVKAKGFADCVAFIQNGECNIAVATNGLLDSQAITIKDAVRNQTGLLNSKIKIIEVK